MSETTILPNDLESIYTRTIDNVPPGVCRKEKSLAAMFYLQDRTCPRLSSPILPASTGVEAVVVHDIKVKTNRQHIRVSGWQLKVDETGMLVINDFLYAKRLNTWGAIDQDTDSVLLKAALDAEAARLDVATVRRDIGVLVYQERNNSSLSPGDRERLVQLKAEHRELICDLPRLPRVLLGFSINETTANLEAVCENPNFVRLCQGKAKNWRCSYDKAVDKFLAASTMGDMLLLPQDCVPMRIQPAFHYLDFRGLLRKDNVSRSFVWDIGEDRPGGLQFSVPGARVDVYTVPQKPAPEQAACADPAQAA